jgi:TELO2-interacting protein 1
LSLEKVHVVLKRLGDKDCLDEKLAEYAFYPITHVFNQSQRLSSRTLEVAVDCTEILVSKGWREKIAPAMAKQLLILIGLLVSKSPKQQLEPPTDELKTSAFACMAVIVKESAQRSSDLFGGDGDRHLVDQMVYQLLEAMSDAKLADVQVTAVRAFEQLQSAIHDTSLLASLLPRTVSTLVKVLRPSTESRRTQKVLVCYVDLLTLVLRKALADAVVKASGGYEDRNGHKKANLKPDHDAGVLDKSWLDATAAQVDLALVQVTKLRTHEGEQLAEALLRLCVMVIDECTQSLARTIPRLLETVAVLCRSHASEKAKTFLRHAVSLNIDLAAMLTAKVDDWSRALPRIMQGNDDKPKQQLLKQISGALEILADNSMFSDDAVPALGSVLIESVASAIESSSSGFRPIVEATPMLITGVISTSTATEGFAPIIYNHQSQQKSAKELHDLVDNLRIASLDGKIARFVLDHLNDLDTNRRIAKVWLSIRLLEKTSPDQQVDVMEFIQDDDTESNFSMSRPALVSDLYSKTVQILLDSTNSSNDSQDWRLIALSLECLIMQASQLEVVYRPELMDTLFPVLTLLGSKNASLQQHAVTALNYLAAATKYESAADMLIDNADYLINAVALQLNSLDISMTSLQVINMTLRLCGVRLLPYLDDLIADIFGALDSFHGYPILVEQLFGFLRLVISESTKNPAILAIESGKQAASRKDKKRCSSLIDDIVSDLQSRKARKLRLETEKGADESVTAPHRPWTQSEDNADEAEMPQNGDEPPDQDDDAALSTSIQDKEKKISKAHQLILDIVQSTVPHLFSPSPKVRLMLLELLNEASPLLARHEDTFLPLINAVWPSVIVRLFSQDPDASGDTAYNVRAAAATVAALCRAAGDFMSSRIGDIFSDLEHLFTRLHKGQSARLVPQRQDQKPNLSTIASQVMELPALEDNNEQDLMIRTRSNRALLRTSDGQVLEALVDLLITILLHVQLSEENLHQVYDLLAPYKHIPVVREALSNDNADVLWLLDHGAG